MSERCNTDPFGTLAWNSDLDWWSGGYEIAKGHHIDLHVQSVNDATALQAFVALAGPVWEKLQANEPNVRVAIAGQMFEAHNGFCSPNDEVTPDQFAERLRLLSVLFESAGTLELCYHDGMLFGGHTIIVPIAANGSIGEATEAG